MLIALRSIHDQRCLQHSEQSIRESKSKNTRAPRLLISITHPWMTSMHDDDAPLSTESKKKKKVFFFSHFDLKVDGAGTGVASFLSSPLSSHSSLPFSLHSFLPSFLCQQPNRSQGYVSANTGWTAIYNLQRNVSIHPRRIDTPDKFWLEIHVLQVAR